MTAACHTAPEAETAMAMETVMTQLIPHNALPVTKDGLAIPVKLVASWENLMRPTENASATPLAIMVAVAT